MSYEKQTELYKSIQLQHREHNYHQFMQMTKDLDNIIFVSLTGSIALSITFIGDIIKNPMSSSVLWLILSWIALGLGLVFIISSYISSISRANKAIVDIDFIFEDEIVDLEELAKPSLKERFVYHLTTLSAVMLIIGLTFMATFAVINIKELTSVEQTEKNSVSINEIAIIELVEESNLQELPNNNNSFTNTYSKGTVGKLIYVGSGWGLVEIGSNRGWIETSKYMVILE